MRKFVDDMFSSERTMKNLTPWLAAIALAANSSAIAATFVFSFSGSSQAGSGTFVTSDVAQMVFGRTAYAITGINGSLNGVSINGLSPGFLGSDNLYFTQGPSFLDGSGVGFSTVAGTTASLYYQDSIPTYRITTVSPFASQFVTAASSSVGSVPEPASWLMMTLGIGAVSLSMRSRKRRKVVA